MSCAIFKPLNRIDLLYCLKHHERFDRCLGGCMTKLSSSSSSNDFDGDILTVSLVGSDEAITLKWCGWACEMYMMQCCCWSYEMIVILWHVGNNSIITGSRAEILWLPRMLLQILKREGRSAQVREYVKCESWRKLHAVIDVAGFTHKWTQPS